MTSLFLILALALCAAWGLSRRQRVKVIAVVDGDTVGIVTHRGLRARLRLRGIDAPETGQRGAREAKQALEEMVLQRWVSARWHGVDRYGRRVATVFSQGRNVSAELVSQGLVFPTPGSGLTWHSLAPRLALRGVWRPGQPAPRASARRRYRVWGWLCWRLERRARKLKRRR